ncbi:MAG: cbb3-type cytochrome c oxidase subunit I [Chloroflexota bacterium]
MNRIGWLEKWTLRYAVVASHHLLSDRPQPLVMRLLSGQFITWGEFLTMGLSVFAALATIWLARPVRLTPALKFVLGSIFGFAIGGMAGLVQANTGLNLILHNTQWVIGIHAHTQLLVGLGMLLFAVIYALLPLLTKLDIRSTRLADVHFWTWLVGAMMMNYATGLAGAQGMLRRTLYDPPIFTSNMAWALAGSLLMAVGFIAFLANLLITLGWGNLVSLVVPDRWRKPLPTAA